MFKSILKLLSVLILTILISIVVFSYEILSTSQKIFSQEGKISTIKQFGEMIFNPAEKLKGEENGRINILLLGIGGKGHSGGELTDTIIIASIKPETKEAALLSIPRDLYVQIPETNINSKINAVKALGDANGKNGLNLLQQLVSEISGVNVDYYVELDFEGFIKIINDVGGLDLELKNDIDDPTYPDFNRGYDPFYISQGWHHLDGATALKVARSRHSKMGDFDRIQRQQNIIRTFKQKVSEKYSKMDILTFKNILNSLDGHLRTNIEPKEIPRFFKIIKEVKNHNITAEVIDTKRYLNRTHIGKGYTLQPKDNNYEGIKKLSADIFKIKISSARKELIKQEGANIEIRNGTGSLDLANIVAWDLEELGYRIINSTNIGLPDFSGVQIYDNSKGLKPNTLEFLKEKFGAIVIEMPNNESSKADFVIVLGRGF